MLLRKPEQKACHEFEANLGHSVKFLAKKESFCGCGTDVVTVLMWQRQEDHEF